MKISDALNDSSILQLDDIQIADHPSLIEKNGVSPHFGHNESKMASLGQPKEIQG